MHVKVLRIPLSMKVKQEHFRKDSDLGLTHTYHNGNAPSFCLFFKTKSFPDHFELN